MALTGPGYPTQQFQNSSKHVRFEVVTVVTMNILFWDMTPRSLVDVYKCFIECVVFFRFLRMLINFYQATWHCIPEDTILQISVSVVIGSYRVIHLGRILLDDIFEENCATNMIYEQGLFIALLYGVGSEILTSV
jgi:hypothetical protein